MGPDRRIRIVAALAVSAGGLLAVAAPLGAQTTPGPSPAPAPTPGEYVVTSGGSTFRIRDLSFTVRSANGNIAQTESPKQHQIALAADVLFDFGKADLTQAARTELAGLAPQIASQAKGPIQIDGYTDSVGDDAFNQTLSQQRADTVKAALARLLASQGNGGSLTLTSAGHGASNFVSPNSRPNGSDDPVGRARNRRVTITYPK